MSSLARTVVRFAGALFLGGVAAVYDTREVTAPRVDVVRSGIEVRTAPAPLVIQPGKRAISFRVPRIALFEFGVRPNSRVDVIDGAQDPNATERSTAGILLSDMRVLAVTPVPQLVAGAGSASEMVVTLEVTPEQAQTIAKARAKGALSVALH